jgi:hypothetical protein
MANRTGRITPSARFAERPTPSLYTALIAPILEDVGSQADPALIEALMRLDPADGGCSVRTLDGLSREDFRSDVLACAEEYALDPAYATRLAETVGYREPR